MVLGVSSFGTSLSESLVWPCTGPIPQGTPEVRTRKAARSDNVTANLAQEYMTESPGERWEPASLMVQLRGFGSKEGNMSPRKRTARLVVWEEAGWWKESRR